ISTGFLLRRGLSNLLRTPLFSTRRIPRKKLAASQEWSYWPNGKNLGQAKPKGPHSRKKLKRLLRSQRPSKSPHRGPSPSSSNLIRQDPLKRRSRQSSRDVLMGTMSTFVGGPIGFLSKALLALDLILWLLCLPIMLRLQAIPTLLERLTGSEKQKKKASMEVKE